MKMLKLTPICLLCVILLFAGSAQQIRSHHTPGDGSDAHPIVDLGNSAYASGGWSSATVEPSISAVDLGDSTYEYDGTGNVELSGRESKSAYLYRTLSEISIEVTVSITFNPGVAKISVPGFGEVSTPSITQGGTIKIKKTGLQVDTPESDHRKVKDTEFRLFSSASQTFTAKAGGNFSGPNSSDTAECTATYSPQYFIYVAYGSASCSGDTDDTYP